MTGIKSRRLRHRVEIQQRVESQHPVTGATIVTWEKYGDRWAEYEPKRIREFTAAASRQNELAGWFTLRYDAGVTPEMRVIHRGKAHDVLGVMPDPDSGLEYLRLEASEGVLVV